MVRAFTIASFALFLVSQLCAQSIDETKYRELLTRVEQGDLSIDFREMRFLCLRVSSCAPRSTPADLVTLAATKDPKEILRLCELQLAKGFVNLEVQAIRVAAYRNMGDISSAARYLDVVTRMSGSILRGKDGKTRETAYEVITDRELYITLTLLGLSYESAGPFATRPGVLAEETSEVESHKYKRYQIQKAAGTPPFNVFFNIDAFVEKSVVR